ncbi:hypothetical protein B9Z55_025352 [Caenorhabditis nigoni]|uniref:Uncharacterized protein n=1 Tax=Caenorhabditis nigoni TaxID=1611254 RepID=A0A2G5SY00_9PELO|nr:hypothetical protein B9Z55_025352 [Caenorhabditis nigoni]
MFKQVKFQKSLLNLPTVSMDRNQERNLTDIEMTVVRAAVGYINRGKELIFIVIIHYPSIITSNGLIPPFMIATQDEKIQTGHMKQSCVEPKGVVNIFPLFLLCREFPIYGF